MNTFKNIVAGVIAAIVVMLLCMLAGLIVMLLWNWLIPGIFGLTKITYLQGAGIWILCDVLFRSNRYSSKKNK